MADGVRLDPFSSFSDQIVEIVANVSDKKFDHRGERVEGQQIITT